MLVPQWVWVDIPLFPGAATPLGPGTTLTWFSPISVTANSPAPMGGLAIAMSNLSVNGSSNISYTVNTLTGSWMGQVTDSTGAIIATQAVQGPGSFSLDFVPASTTATFSLLSTLPGGTINVAHPGYKTLIYVPGTVTRTLCDNEKDKYRFGFNGQEKDNEISGVGNFTSALDWEYSTRTGRRWNPDPKGSAGLSLYSAFSNNPIWYKDPNGDTVTFKGYDKPNKNHMSFTQANNVWNAMVSFMQHNGEANGINTLIRSTKDYEVKFIDDTDPKGPRFESDIDEDGNKIPGLKPALYINPYFAVKNPHNGYIISPIEVTGHEIEHAVGYDKDPCENFRLSNIPDPQYGTAEEKRVITGPEQRIGRNLGLLFGNMKTRDDHKGEVKHVNTWRPGNTGSDGRNEGSGGGTETPSPQKKNEVQPYTGPEIKNHSIRVQIPAKN